MLMNWSQKYGLRSYLKSSLWLVPFIAIPIELVVTRLLHGLDGWLGWALLGLTVQGAQALLGAFLTVALSCVVFTFGWLRIVIPVSRAHVNWRVMDPAC